MGEPALWTLAFALSAIFGGFGVLIGVGIAVQRIRRDEERYSIVAEAVEAIRGDQSRLRIDWGKTLEELEQLAAATERNRRRVAASDSAAKRNQAEEPPVPLTPSQQRDEIRKRMRRVV